MSGTFFDCACALLKGLDIGCMYGKLPMEQNQYNTPEGSLISVN